jgi:uncharacterized membrane protein
MVASKQMRQSLRLFVAALAVVVMVFVLLALPYAVTEVHGQKAKELVLPMRLVLAVFLAGLLIFWIVRHRQTGHDLEMLREEIERNRLAREKSRTPHVREADQKERGK